MPMHGSLAPSPSVRSQLSALIPFGVPLAAVGARHVSDDEALLAVDGHVLVVNLRAGRMSGLGERLSARQARR